VRFAVATDRGAGQVGFSASRGMPLLVGRAREQELLREELAATLSGHGRLVLLGGEAGIGKTALARELAREAEEHGVRVVAGHCYDLTNTPPYGPWLDLFGNDRLRSLVPEPPAAFAGGRLEQITDQAALFAEVRRFFAEVAALGPVLILLEDLHWADPASVDLLRHVAPHVGHWRALLVATYRIDDLTRRHPFYQQLPALVREADGIRLDLRRLDADDVRALVAGRIRLSGADEGRLAAYLERHAEGNPFFTVELIRALEEAGLLRAGTDRSFLGELTRVVVPPLLRQVIDGRVARLGEGTRQPLAIAAVIGQEVPLDLWAALAGLNEDTLLEIVERAADAHLVEATSDGTRVRFVHALTREALVEGLLPPRRRLWHRRIAETLVADAGADPDAVAYHFQQAGDARAWEWFERAGERAQRGYAWLTAIDRFRTAATLLAGVEGQERQRGRLLYRLSRLQRFSDPIAGIETHEEAGRLAAEAGDDALVADIRFSHGVLLCYSDRFRAGLAQIIRGIEELEALPLEATRGFTTSVSWMADALPARTAIDTTGDELAEARLHAAGLHFRRGVVPWFLASAGQPHAAAPIANRFIAVLADVPGMRGGIRATTAFAFHGLGIANAALGRPDESHVAFVRARQLFGELDHHAVIAFSLLTELWDVTLRYETAEPDLRRRLAAEAEAALGRAGGALRPGVSPRLAWLGCFILDGRWEEAVEVLRTGPDPGNAYLRRVVTGTDAVLARHRGEPEAAWAHIRRRLPDGPATEPGDIIHQEGLFLQRLAADLCLDRGDLTTAKLWMDAHDRWLDWSESVLGRAEGQVVWGRCHYAAGDTVHAQTLAAAALDLAAAPDQPLVRLAAHRLLGEIETGAGHHAAAEEHLTVSLDLAHACEAPFERALTLLAVAELRVATGEHAEAVRLLDEVRHICTPLGAAPTLARADALAARSISNGSAATHPAGLTQREVDVLRLLARHLTDKEIAEALFVGPRTVQTHVANILNKLGVENRRAAAVEAARLGLV
jgi:DNA-binding CsgD family transcriptional regulator